MVTLGQKNIEDISLPELRGALEKSGFKQLPTLSSTAKGGAELPEQPQTEYQKFENALTKATEFAKAKSNKLNTGALFEAGFTPGNVAPSTFASILKNMNRSYEDTVKEELKDVKEKFNEITPAQAILLGETLTKGIAAGVPAGTLLSTTLSKFNADTQLKILQSMDWGVIKEESKDTELSNQEKETLSAYLSEVSGYNSREEALADLKNQESSIKVRVGESGFKAIASEIDKLFPPSEAVKKPKPANAIEARIEELRSTGIYKDDKSLRAALVQQYGFTPEQVDGSSIGKTFGEQVLGDEIYNFLFK